MEALVGVAFGDPLSTDATPGSPVGTLVPSLQPFGFLHPSERSLVGPRATDKRRGDFVRGRWVAKQVIARLTGTPFGPEIRVLRDARGVPDVLVEGREQGSIRASISHTMGLAAAGAVETPLFIGVDAERWLQMPSVIARDYFTQEEVALYENQHQSSPAAAAVIWSLKESMLKVLGEGLRMSTRQVQVVSWEPPSDESSDWQEATVRAPIPQGTKLQAWVHEDEGWVLTVAILEPSDLSESVAAPPIVTWNVSRQDMLGPSA